MVCLVGLGFSVEAEMFLYLFMVTLRVLVPAGVVFPIGEAYMCVIREKCEAVFGL